MRVIGVTGGVGSGKSEVLEYMRKNYDACVIQADRVGHELMEPGRECYDEVVKLFGEECLKADKSIDRKAVSDIVFREDEMRLKLNAIVHPAVRKAILQKIAEERMSCRKYVLVEAALFVEAHYEEFCDEVWYVHTDEAMRLHRLQAYRGYSPEKSRSIMRQQLSDQEFAAHADFIIDNNGLPVETIKQIQKRLRENEILQH